MTKIGIHANPEAVLSQGELGVMGVVSGMIAGGTVHPTNAVCVLIVSLTRELGLQARLMGREKEADEFLGSLGALVKPAEVSGPASDALARDLNRRMMALLGVTSQ